MQSNIDKVIVLPSVPGGPWTTKSGGKLMAPVNLDPAEAMKFLHIPTAELEANPKLHSGLRVYFQTNLKANARGGGEFHRGRQEIIIVVTGRVLWYSEDLAGHINRKTLEPGMAILVPPYIMHSYTVLDDDTILLVIANTDFDPEGGEQGKDTYSLNDFRALQSQAR